MPNLVAYDLAGVQPMNGPTGLIFAMRTRYDGQSGREAFFNEPDSAFSAQDSDTSLTQGDYVLNATDGEQTLVSVQQHKVKHLQQMEQTHLF